jgi:hypothetical protein
MLAPLQVPLERALLHLVQLVLLELVRQVQLVLQEQALLQVQQEPLDLVFVPQVHLFHHYPMRYQLQVGLQSQDQGYTLN